MPTLGWDDLAELFLPGYAVGTWFLVDDLSAVPPIFGPRRKSHPHVLIESCSFGEEVAARTFFRSTTSGDIPHGPHPPGCSERCVITEPGWIVASARSVKLQSLKGNFSCVEKDSATLLAIDEIRSR